MSEPIQIRATYFTDPEDPDGPAMFRLEFHPVPQELGKEILQMLYDQGRTLLIQNMKDGLSLDLTATGLPN